MSATSAILVSHDTYIQDLLKTSNQDIKCLENCCILQLSVDTPRASLNILYEG